jgi:hypothetical protein
MYASLLYMLFEMNLPISLIGMELRDCICYIILLTPPVLVDIPSSYIPQKCLFMKAIIDAMSTYVIRTAIFVRIVATKSVQ